MFSEDTYSHGPEVFMEKLLVISTFISSNKQQLTTSKVNIICPDALGTKTLKNH